MVRRVRVRAMAAVALTLAMTAGACGNDGGSGGGNGSDDGGTSAGAPTQAQAQAALLATSDFPSGWEGGPSTGTAADDGNDEICEEIDTEDEIAPSVKASAKFTAAQTGPFALHAVALYRDEDEASKVMDLLVDAFEKCKEFTDAEDQRGVLSGTFTNTSPQDLGDEALGATIAATGTGVSMAGDMVVVREGRGVFIVTLFGFEIAGFGGGTVPQGLTEQLAAKALAKLEAAA